MYGQEDLLEALKVVYDPEVGVNIVDLGLIYDIQVDENGTVGVRMTMTTPGCPVTNLILHGVTGVLRSLPGVSAVNIDLVWDPPWTPDRISEEGRRQLGWA